MKKISTNTTSKYVVSTLLTVVCTAGVALAWSGLNASPGDKLDAAKWNELVTTMQSNSAVPSGAVMSFNLATCPTGWSAYTAGQGRAIIGAGAGAGLTARNLGDVGGGESTPQININAIANVNIGNLTANTTINVGTATTGGSSAVLGNGGLTSAPTGAGTAAAIYLPSGTAPSSPVALGGVSTSIGGTATATLSTVAGGNSTDNMQPFVALLYCQKN